MKRTIFAAVLFSAFASTAAFADGGSIGPAGSYHDQSWVGASTKTRAEVRAEVAAARRDGTLPSMNKQSYPSLGLEGQTQAERVAARDAGHGVALARAGE
jgi:hypothetical protein